MTERVRAHLIASPFGTIHAAMFSLPRPVGTAIPHPPVYALANFDPTDITGSIGSQWLGDASAPLQFPTVNRKSKRDSFMARAREPMPPTSPQLAIAPMPDAAVDSSLDKGGPRFDPYSQYEFATVPDSQLLDPNITARAASAPDQGKVIDQAKAKNLGHVFFGTHPFGAEQQAIAPWAPGQAPVVIVSIDPDIKQSALTPPQPSAGSGVGETIARKGEVTGVGQRPRSPAERLALSGAARAKAEKCLANAVYFESRDEPVRAQIAVAQVVLNRVFSPFYPNDVCAVVYQNAHRRFACQFTFACDGTPDVVTEPDAWARAQRIARDTLDGKLWMPEVAKSTHYHDDWARPNCVG